MFSCWNKNTLMVKRSQKKEKEKTVKKGYLFHNEHNSHPRATFRCFYFWCDIFPVVSLLLGKGEWWGFKLQINETRKGLASNCWKLLCILKLFKLLPFNSFRVEKYYKRLGWSLCNCFVKLIDSFINFFENSSLFAHSSIKF